MKKIIVNLVANILRIIPTTNIIVFNSFPDYTDNAYAIYCYIYKKYGCKYKYVWLINERENVKKIQKQVNNNVCVYYKMSVMGIWTYIRCRYCFFTHGILESLTLHQHKDKMINMWHGMPLKVVGVADGKGEDYMHNTDVLLANSFLFQGLMAKCFNVPLEKVLPIGQPRCDTLFNETDYFEKNDINRNDYSKIGIWLPTYMVSIHQNEKRIDGAYKKGCISFMNEELLSRLDEELVNLNQLLIVKLHPMDILQTYRFKSYCNIRIVKQDDFNCQLYPLLGNCDYLLTDFSSVSVDFDICRKPMGFPISDLKSYQEGRGFMFDDIASVLPGPIIKNYDELIDFIRNPIYNPSNVELNCYYDSNASKRLTEYLNL